MTFSKNKFPFNRARFDPFFIKGLALLCVSVLLALWLYGYHGADWETLTTKHYWNAQSWYYGGYGNLLEKTPDGYRMIQKESLGNYDNLFPFSEKNKPAEAQYRITGIPATERLFAPFLTYLIITVTRSRVNVWDAFYALNIILWLCSIFCAYQLAAIYFEDRYSPFFAALSLIFYPAFTLNFHGLKLAYANTALLLAGIFLFEKTISRARIHLRLIYLTALFFLGLFATGGWAFLFVYLCIRQLTLPRSDRYIGIISVTLALVAAQIALGYLRGLYQLPTAEQQMHFSYGEMFSQSVTWLKTWTSGGDVSTLKFLNYSGVLFFNEYLPLIFRSFFLGHWVLLLLSIPAFISLPKARIFILTAILLFATGHGGYVISGWIWHYGYLSAPAAMMLILAVSGFLGQMASQPLSYRKALAVALLVAALLGTFDRKLHASLYYGGFLERYQTRAILYYGGSDEVTER